jgi:phage terminase large subunit
MAVNLTNVFDRNFDAYQSGEHLIINQGGQGSSKTYSILQLLYLISTRETKRITIASYALPHLKAGAMFDFDRIIESFGMNPHSIKNVSESTYRINDSIIEFFGIEGNIAKAHGPRRDILFINECNRKITYDVYDMLATRTQGSVFLDFNPDQEFWLHEKVLPNFKYRLIKSNYLDNLENLPEKELKNILSKKDKLGFENWWKVYGLGELGKLEGAIFMNWRYLRDDEEWPGHLPHTFGLDFGFNDPDALIKIAIDHKNKKMYWDEKIYKEGNTFNELKNLMQSHCTRNDLITADCADARMIRQLSEFFNIKPVDKKKWTVAEALKMMQDYEHILTRSSVNLGREFINYIWSDKKAGVPIDDFSHGIDAGRYRFMESVTKGGAQRWYLSGT